MKSKLFLFSSLLTMGSMVIAQAPAAPAKLDEIDKIFIRLDGIKEKCLAEDLPRQTVALIKHSARVWNSATNMPQDTPVQILTTVRDSTGHMVTRQQSKAKDRIFITAPTSGEHLICYQAILSQYSPNLYVKLGMEVFIGDAGDPNITSPVEAQLSDLSYQISLTEDLVNDLQREQTLQREREDLFVKLSKSINGKVWKWAFVQIIVLIGLSFYQNHHLRRFFRTKKLV